MGDGAAAGNTTDDLDDIGKLPVPLDRDRFLRQLMRELAGTLENVVGIEEANGFISVVGAAVGEQIDRDYRSALQVERLSRDQVRDVMLDLKARIQGDFYVIEEDEQHLVLGNRTCPFGDKVVGRTSLCMMTSNVFGHLAAQNLGYGRVVLEQTIAAGAPQCRVTIYFNPGREPGQGREYVRWDSDDTGR